MRKTLELTEETDFKVTMSDCRRAGHCPQGVRRWFEGQGLDFRDFLKNGLSAKTILETGSGLGHQVVSRALEHRERSL